MNFARKNVRFVWVLLLAAVCMLLFAAPALAAEDPIEFSIEITPQSMTAPGDIQVSLRVANTSDRDMIDPVTLYDPAGNVVTGFGDGGSYILAAGSFRTWEGTWKVTQEELNAGEFAYQVKYHIEDENGDLVEMSRPDRVHGRAGGPGGKPHHHSRSGAQRRHGDGGLRAV